MSFPRSNRRFLAPAAIFTLSAPFVSACGDPPQELSSPVMTAAPTPAVAPLVYDPPGTWTKLGESQVNSKRAGFKIPKAGADSEEAELTVFFFGTGSLGDADKQLGEWQGQFDAGAQVSKKTLDSPAGKVDVIEIAGTYKVPLGPALGPKKKSPMQMVKEKWRLYGAVVRTKERGNWFFKMVGPSDTVQAAQGGMDAMLQAAK